LATKNLNSKRFKGAFDKTLEKRFGGNFGEVTKFNFEDYQKDKIY
jgi:hypothetical protein